MTLIEIVVAITILGMVGAFATSFILLTLDSYLESRMESVEATRLYIAVQQIANELSSAFPSTIRIDNAGGDMYFEQVLTAGIATSIKNNILMDRNNSAFSVIAPGMRLLFHPFSFPLETFVIQSVNPNASMIHAEGVRDDFPRAYWILHRSIRYTLRNRQIIMSWEPLGTTNAIANQSVLCGNVDGFTVQRNPDDTLLLEIEGVDAKSLKRLKEMKVATLKWGN